MSVDTGRSEQMAFVPLHFLGATSLQSREVSTSIPATCCRTCTACLGSGLSSRRSFLKTSIASLASVFVGSGIAMASEKKSTTEQVSGDLMERDAKPEPDSSVCKNCSGSGKVTCDLCSGTGFWRALAKNDINQKYQGVVCPECEGVGTLTCPVCLGTGEGNIRGLLRRRRVEPGPGRVLQTNI